MMGPRVVVTAFALGVLFVPALARAQAPEISMTADRSTVAVGEVFQLQIRVSTTGQSAIEHIQLPALDAFVVEGRSISRPMQFSFGFGQGPVVRQTTVYTFDLKPRQPGRFTLAAVEAQLAGVAYRGQPLTISVVPAGAGLPPTSLQPVPQTPIDPFGPNPLFPGFPGFPGLTPIPGTPGVPAVPTIPVQPLPPNASPLVPDAIPPEGLTGAQFDDQLFVRTVLDKPRAYIGEQVTLTVYLYTRVGIRDLDVPQEPSTDGFWVEDLLGPIRRLEFRDQYVGTSRFEVAVIRKMALFPIQAGTITLSPMEVLATASTGGFFGSAQIRRSGVPVNLEVLPLPAEGQPPGFEASNVGRYELEARVDRSAVQAGDAVTLTVTVRGDGNLRNLRLPSLASAPGLRIYDPQVHDSIAPRGDVIGGERRVEYLVIPEAAGRWDVPVPSLSFFDPAAREYRTRAPAPIRITVTGSAGQIADAAPRAQGQSERTIRLSSDLRRRAPRLYETPWFVVAVAVPPLAYLGLLVGSALAGRRRERREKTRPRRAAAAARRILAGAEQARRAGDATACFAAVARGLHLFLEERLQRPVGGLTMEELRRTLEERGFPDELVERLVGELENCDFARFTPEGGRAREMTECLDRARGLVEELDRVAVRPDPEAKP